MILLVIELSGPLLARGCPLSYIVFIPGSGRGSQPGTSAATTEPGDASLLAAIAGGDQLALGVLYDRHASAAMGLAYRVVGDRRTAEEVVQDAFVAVWRRASTYSAARGEARSWLLAIVQHRAIDRLRQRAGDAVEVDVAAV